MKVRVEFTLKEVGVLIGAAQHVLGIVPESDSAEALTSAVAKLEDVGNYVEDANVR